MAKNKKKRNGNGGNAPKGNRNVTRQEEELRKTSAPSRYEKKHLGGKLHLRRRRAGSRGVRHRRPVGQVYHKIYFPRSLDGVIPSFPQRSFSPQSSSCFRNEEACRHHSFRRHPAYIFVLGLIELFTRQKAAGWGLFSGRSAFLSAKSRRSS